MEDDLKRCRRFKWIMKQQEIFINPKEDQGGKQINTVGPILKNKMYEVAHILEHFILADTLGPGGLRFPLNHREIF